jgi:uncharacterized lipoprotein NlpE involved in copper resistance
MRTIILALLLFALACKEKPVDARIDNNDTTSAAQPALKPESTAWVGTYSGTLPCWADCTGLKTELTVKADSTYSLSSQAMGLEDKPNVYSGTYHLQSSTKVITLDAEGDHLKFLIQDNSLKKLDKFGNPEQGASQERYVLAKVN